MNKKKRCVGVCIGGSCYNNGSEQIMEIVEKYYGITAGEADENMELDFIGCLGNCDFGVNIEVDGEVLTQVTKNSVIALIENGALSDSKKQDQIIEGSSLEELLSKELDEL